MSRRLRLGVVGVDARTAALAQRLSVDGAFSPGTVDITRWGAGPTATDRDLAIAAAAQVGADYAPDWHDIATSRDIDAVYVGGPVSGRSEAVVEALRHGRPVLCPGPVAVSPEGIEPVMRLVRAGCPALLSPTDLSVAPEVVRAMELVGTGDLGDLRSVFAAIRAPRVDGVAEVGPWEDLGYALVDFLIACVPAAWTRVFAAQARLFSSGREPDTATAIVSFEGGPVVSLETSHCLPAGCGAQVEIDLVGSESTIRLQPEGRLAVLYTGLAEPRLTLTPWPAPPVANMLKDLDAAILSGGSASRELAHHQVRVIGLLQALRQAGQSGEAVVRSSGAQP